MSAKIVEDERASKPAPFISRSSPATRADLLHSRQLHDAALGVDRCRNDADAAQYRRFAKALRQHVKVMHSVEEGNDRGLRANRRGEICKSRLESIRLHGEEHDVVGRRNLPGRDQLRLDHSVAVRADEVQAAGLQLRGTCLPHEEGHVSARLRQASPEVSAGRTCPDDEHPCLLRRLQQAHEPLFAAHESVPM